MATQSNQKSPTMAELLAGQSFKPVHFSRGDKVQGKIIAITEDELVVDLGAKAEGVANLKDLGEAVRQELKIGDNFEAFVAQAESSSGQIILTPFEQITVGGRRGQEQMKKWQRFIAAMHQKTTVTGRVLEVNKGGLLVETGSASSGQKVRGFIPSSQIGIENLAGQGLSGLVGQELPLKVVEVDPGNNRLILTARVGVSEETESKLAEVSEGQKVSGKVVAVAPFGLFLDINGLEGVVFPQEVAWEEPGDLGTLFKVGQEISGKIIGKDETAGKAIVSLRQLSEDPFDKVAENFQTDDVVTGTVSEISQDGVMVQLEGGVEGFVPADKVEVGNEYTVDQRTNFLVDSVDKARRRINLAPFLTSTKGLIYK